ncbi:hypothetical protein OBBRIDRAFT_890334 [Obba rivulosa]|uniref:Uncharacterized protein n=1 Tax=Obba rivulosa TaxID=1052685 RepID=A0A8E2AL78_9APHY|nr:hypothetical protein OBBRIDRAFT_890334 [Obba rivulosa]
MRAKPSSALSSTRGPLARSPRRSRLILSRANSSAASEAPSAEVEKPPPTIRSSIPRLSSFGDISIPKATTTPRRLGPINGSFKPTLSWLSVDEFSVGGSSFAQRLAQRKQAQEAQQTAKAELEAAQTTAEAKKADQGQFRLSRKSQRTTEKRRADAKPTHSDPGPDKAAETFNNLVTTYSQEHDTVSVAKADRKDARAVVSSRQKRAQAVAVPLPTIELQTNLDALFGTSSTTLAAPQAAQKSFAAKGAALPSSIQRTLERAGGDYSRYSPLSVGTLDPEKITTVQRARLLFGKRRESSLNQRQKALDVVHRLVPAESASQAAASL